MWAGACGGCLRGAVVQEVVDVHAQEQAEVGAVSTDKPGKELENGGHSEVGAERPQERVDQVRRDYIDPTSLVRILRTKHVRLLRAEWILEWIDGGRGPLPCRQGIPEEAFVDVDALDEKQLASLIVISISYCWISQDHPDPECYHLETLGSLLRCFLKSSYSSAPDEITVNTELDRNFKWNLRNEGTHFGARDGRCVGVFLDWTALYQDKPIPRTHEQKKVFKEALESINIWYAHITTIVWMLTSLPPGVQRNGYHDSGWTTFEASVASILTKGTDMLDITGDERHKLLNSDNSRLHYIQLSHDLMSRQSRVPAMPDEFGRIIDGKVFTNGADKDDVVKPRYLNTFFDLIPSSPAIQYAGLGLTTQNVYNVLNLASAHIKKLETLDLSFNESIDLPIQDFVQLKRLTTLKLAVTGVTGDLAALEPLVNLENLNLSDTQVGGDVGALRALVKLRDLRLGETQVTGDVGQLRALVHLTALGLDGTQVTGDVGALQSLVKLTVLRLGGTQVTGDVGKLQALGNLSELGIGETKVAWDVCALQAFVNLTQLNLGETQITGNVRKVLVNLRTSFGA